MKKALLFASLSLFLSYFQAQDKPLVKFTLATGVYDTLALVSYDTSIIRAQTDFHFGIDSMVEVLPMTTPTQNLYNNTSFTRKRKTALDFNLNHYPLRTTIKLFNEDDDTLADNCSGVMISKKHVLTAAHCVVDHRTDSISNDSIYACPVYNNGIFSTSFNCSYVDHVYYFDGWSFSGEDIAVLELSDSIGLSTGWVGIGFDKVDSTLLNGLFYKFSYPSVTFLGIDSNTYNGDTLYYNYGIADYADINSVGISGTSGIPGESGSSLLKVANQTDYTSYGTLSFSNGLRHSRIDNYEFFAIKNIIESDLLNSLEENSAYTLQLFPNPVKNTLNIQSKSGIHVIENVIIVDATGRKIWERNKTTLPLSIDMSELNKGLYVVILDHINTYKIIKN